MVGRGVPAAPQTVMFTHDLDGNLTNDCTFAYSYDAENRLASVASNGVVFVSNQYDYRGRRIRKTTPTTETTFVYDGWNLIHKTVTTITGTTTNTTELQYFWGADLSETLQGAGGVGGLLAVSINGNFYFPAYDNNGNITKYIDESGNVVAEYTYDAFGRTIAQSGLMADIFRHRFSTKYFDSETGLYYYGYRFYSSSLMRWLNRDLIEEGGGLNLYSFCKNMMAMIDYLGLYVNVEYDVANKTLMARDVDSGVSIILKEKVYSGNGKSCCVKDDQWKSGMGPLPVGRYLIGLSYVPTQHSSDTGDYNWYRLYGSNGKGGYTYNNIPVKTPTGVTVYRGGFNLHTGRMSDGCVTVWSDVSQGDAGYPHSDDYDKLKAILDKTKPLRYKNSNYAGWLEVK